MATRELARTVLICTILALSSPVQNLMQACKANAISIRIPYAGISLWLDHMKDVKKQTLWHKLHYLKLLHLITVVISRLTWKGIP
jgi:hypothetical protein